MTTQQLTDLTLSMLAFVPNDRQLALIHALSSFIINRGPRDVFVLNGYAGTGKTSVMGATVKALRMSNVKTFLLAPTGRAAKVAAAMSGDKASTIHKRIFRGDSTNPSNTTFFLAENKDAYSLFIVDEASLVTDGQSFSSSLLQQMCRHVYGAPGCVMLFFWGGSPPCPGGPAAPPR